MTEENWINVVMDSQIMSVLQSCPQKVEYKFNQHLVPIQGVSKSFQKGQLVHLGAEHYWNARIEGKDYRESSVAGLEAAKKSSHAFPKLEAEDKLEVYEHLILYFQYINTQPWIPIATEKHFRVKVYEVYPLRIFIEGRIDLLVKSPQMELLPVDIKTESERWFHSSMSNQFRFYAMACGVNTLGVQRFGFQKTLKTEDKFKLDLISLEADVLEEFRTQTLPYWANQLIKFKRMNYWPKNHSSCISGYFSCEFSDKQGKVCSASPAIRNEIISRYFTTGEPWEPGKARD